MSERVSASEIYSHDGIRDSLTHLAAPPYFYENLRREIASSTRNGQPLSVIKFIIQSDGSSYEDSVLDFANLLSKSFREEDLIARMGKYEFALLIQGTEEIASRLIMRLLSDCKGLSEQDSNIGFALVSWNRDENSLGLLSRLDERELCFV
jgi:GGDEF domain-containing protein